MTFEFIAARSTTDLPISPPLSYGTCPREHCVLLSCQYVFLPYHSTVTSTAYVKLLTFTSQLCVTYGSASILIPPGQSLVWWLELDSITAILYCTSVGNLNKLQRVMNTLARVISGTRKSDHITPVLADLHWLPVASRVNFKIALMTYKTITTRKSEYLADLLSFKTTSRSLRSSSKMRLHGDAARTVFASRAFCRAAPSIWNALSAHLTVFLYR